MSLVLDRVGDHFVWVVIETKPQREVGTVELCRQGAKWNARGDATPRRPIHRDISGRGDELHSCYVSVRQKSRILLPPFRTSAPASSPRLVSVGANSREPPPPLWIGRDGSLPLVYR